MKYKGLDKKNAISIVTVGIVFIVLYIIYKIFQYLKDPFGTKREEDELKEDLEFDLSNLTYPKYWYTASADTLETALLAELNEDEEVVSGIIWEIHNDDDIAALIEAFGVRQKVFFGAIPSQNYNLITAVQNFTPEMVQHYNNHFEGWAMSFRF